jgi:hypothetical protein
MLNQTLKATVYGIQQSKVDDNRYVKTFIGELASDENTKGISLMSIPTDPRVFDEVTIKNFPCECDIGLQVSRGGQNKMAQRVVSITEFKGPKG